MDKETALKRWFGYDSFRPGQAELTDALLAGRDVLGVMPTGGGKSVCYQVPALLLPGVTVVISPLISLMKDQVEALSAAGIPAAFINSSLSGDELREIYRRAWRGEFKLLYAAPERLSAEGFLKLAQGLEIPLVAVDEAHCVSQWGQDFRPSYLKIPEFLDRLPRRPALAAFTATATGQVREDIVRLLGLRDPVTVVTGFDRPNLFFQVLRPEHKLVALKDLLARRRGKSGIVYCATRAGVERVCGDLRDAGYAAARYHAGLSEEERRQNQEDFRFDRCPVMVATNAFGMGIDKSNVSYVIHYNMPKSLEAYYQEAGRAGRDGERAECILLFSPGDIRTARFLIDNSHDNEELTPRERAEARRRDYDRLDAMTAYCRTRDCLRGAILDYFGQPHSPRCGTCGNCLEGYELTDITSQAQMILSCIERIRVKLGYCVGPVLVSRVLRGSRDKRVLELGLDTVTTYGLMRETPGARVKEYLDYLEAQGYTRVDPDHGALRITPAARGVLFHGERVSMPLPRETKTAERVRRARGEAEPLTGEEERLFTTLKDLRYRLAQKEGVPPFVIFSNASLRDMAVRKPRSMAAFLQVSGVGETKARKYGPAFLPAIQAQEESAR